MAGIKTQTYEREWELSWGEAVGDEYGKAGLSSLKWGATESGSHLVVWGKHWNCLSRVVTYWNLYVRKIITIRSAGLRD